MLVLCLSLYALGVLTLPLINGWRDVLKLNESAGAGPCASPPPAHPTHEGPRPLVPIATIHRDFKADIRIVQRRDRWRSRGTP